MWCLKCITTFLLVKIVNCEMESFVIQGSKVDIRHYPHSVFLNIYCRSPFICGGSLLNQLVVLTAGHCLEDCSRRYKEEVYVNFGHENIDRMWSRAMKNFLVHENYDQVLMFNDVALVSVTNPIPLGRAVRRVALMLSPPKNIKLAHMAGWGVMNSKKDVSQVLLEGTQELQSPNLCRSYLGPLPNGAFCAGPLTGPGSPDQGDSGSALVIQDYVQIGIVSYKVKKYSLVVYTNVSYHYGWISRNAVRLACQRNK